MGGKGHFREVLPQWFQKCAVKIKCLNCCLQLMVRTGKAQRDVTGSVKRIEVRK